MIERERLAGDDDGVWSETGQEIPLPPSGERPVCVTQGRRGKWQVMDVDDGVWQCSAETGQEMLLVLVSDPPPPRRRGLVWALLAVVLGVVAAMAFGGVL